MNQTYALAALYARRLFENLPNTASMGAPGEAGRFAAHRVNQLRNFFFKVTHDATGFLEIGSHHAQASRYFVDQLPDERRAFASEAHTSVHVGEDPASAKKHSVSQHVYWRSAYRSTLIWKNGARSRNAPSIGVDHIEIRVPMYIRREC